MKPNIFSRNWKSRDTPRISVTIPARNEAEALPGLLESLSAQVDESGRERRDFQVVILVNGSSDDTEYVAEEAMRNYDLSGAVLLWTADQPTNIGLLRRTLMDYSLSTMSDGPHPWVGWTDADCLAAPDWLAATDELIRQGFGAVGGHIDVDYDQDNSANRLHWLRYLYHDKLNALWRSCSNHPDDRHSEHHFNCGASLAIALDAYREIEPVPALAYEEDKVMWQRIAQQGYRTIRSKQVRVHTSSRQQGRCRGGLAAQLQDLEYADRRQRWLFVPSLPNVAQVIEYSNELVQCWQPDSPKARRSLWDAWQQRMRERFYAFRGYARNEVEHLLYAPMGFQMIQTRLRYEFQDFVPHVALQEALND